MVLLAAVLVLTIVHPFVNSEEYRIPENVDLDEILKSERLTRNYVDCIVDKGKCTSEGEDLKKYIPEALENDCAKCNEKHREGVKKVLQHLVKNHSDWWQELLDKYDPNGEYKQKYDHYLKEELRI